MASIEVLRSRGGNPPARANKRDQWVFSTAVQNTIGGLTAITPRRTATGGRSGSATRCSIPPRAPTRLPRSRACAPRANDDAADHEPGAVEAPRANDHAADHEPEAVEAPRADGHKADHQPDA